METRNIILIVFGIIFLILGIMIGNELKKINDKYDTHGATYSHPSSGMLIVFGIVLIIFGGYSELSSGK